MNANDTISVKNTSSYYGIISALAILLYVEGRSQNKLDGKMIVKVRKKRNNKQRLPRCKSCHGSSEKECENTFLLVVRLIYPGYLIGILQFPPYTESDWNAPDISIFDRP